MISTASSLATTTASGTSTAWASLPGGELKVSFAIGDDDSVLVLASLSRVQHSAANSNIALRIIVDGSTVVAISNTGQADGNYYRHNALHGALSGLSTGEHTAEVQYKIESGTAYIPYHAADGSGYLSVTATIVPSWQLVTAALLPASTATGNCPGASGSCTWASMPGGVVSVTFLAREANEKVLVVADISRVQAAAASHNVALAIFVNGAFAILAHIENM